MSTGMQSPAFARRPRIMIGMLLAVIVLLSLAVRLFFGLRPAKGLADYDERYNLRNVARIVETGKLDARQNAYYSFLSFAPQAAFAMALQRLSDSGADQRFTMVADGRTTERALYCFRTVQAFYGAALVLVVFLLGRKLGGDAAGLLAATLASSSLFFVRSGAWFKPDALASLTAMLAILWAVEAQERPTPARFARAGVGIGLATSAKLIGALSSIYLGLAVIFSGSRDPRRWFRLALAAATSALTYFVLTPGWRDNLRAWKGVSRDYAWRSSGDTYLGVLERIFGGLFSQIHGPVVAALFWFGLIAAFTPAATRHFEPARRCALRILAVTPLLYTFGALLLAHVPFLRNNIVFPCMPLVTVTACVTAVELGRRLAARAPRLDHAAFRWAAALLLIAPPVAIGVRDMYELAVPTTEDILLAGLSRQFEFTRSGSGARIVFLEASAASGEEWEGRGRSGGVLASFVRINTLSRLDPGRLTLGDAEIFPESRLRGAEREFYLSRLAAANIRGSVEFVRPQFPRVRGPALVLALHRWAARSRETLAPPARAAGAALESQLPSDLAEDELISFVVQLPDGAGEAVQVRLGDQILPLHRASKPGKLRGYLRLTERILAPVAGARVELVTDSVWASPPASSRGIGLDLWRWGATVEPEPEPGNELLPRPAVDGAAGESAAGELKSEP